MSARIGAPVQFWSNSRTNSQAPYPGVIVALNSDGTVKVRASVFAGDTTSSALYDCAYFGSGDSLGSTGNRCQALYD